jgi:alpha-ribazole phosphatase
MENRVLYLVRHGKVVQPDDQRRYLGQHEVPLSPEGEQQARHLARRFAHVRLGALVSSDLGRAVRTAELIAQSAHVPVVARSDLREIAMGAWEGRTFREVAQAEPEAFRARGEDLANYQVPGGESFAQCGRRAVAALEDLLANTTGTLLIVGHAGVNRLLLCHLLGMPVANLFRLGQDYACLNVIQCGSAGFQVKLVNGRARHGTRHPPL